MILSGLEIEKSVQEGSIVIEPFDPAQLTTNSYDFRLGPTILEYTSNPLDPRVKNPTQTLEIPTDGIVLNQGGLYLGATFETMGSNTYVPIIKGKSSIGRLGLFIHATADLIDLGSVNRWTLQLVPTLDIRLYAEMLIGQVTFWEVNGETVLYEGKYQGATGPMASFSYLDFENGNP